MLRETDTVHNAALELSVGCCLLSVLRETDTVHHAALELSVGCCLLPVLRETDTVHNAALDGKNCGPSAKSASVSSIKPRPSGGRRCSSRRVRGGCVRLRGLLTLQRAQTNSPQVTPQSSSQRERASERGLVPELEQ